MKRTLAGFRVFNKVWSWFLFAFAIASGFMGIGILIAAPSTAKAYSIVWFLFVPLMFALRHAISVADKLTAEVQASRRGREA